MATIQVGVPIPLFDRGQGGVAVVRWRHAATIAGVGQSRLKVQDRLTVADQRYENADLQLILHAKQVIPDATAALAQVDKDYEAKVERFFDTLNARRVFSTARLEYANLLGELWVAEIEALIQSIRKYLDGTRLGYRSCNRVTEWSECRFRQRYNRPLHSER